MSRGLALTHNVYDRASPFTFAIKKIAILAAPTEVLLFALINIRKKRCDNEVSGGSGRWEVGGDMSLPP